MKWYTYTDDNISTTQRRVLPTPWVLKILALIRVGKKLNMLDLRGSFVVFVFPLLYNLVLGYSSIETKNTQYMQLNQIGFLLFASILTRQN